MEALVVQYLDIDDFVANQGLQEYAHLQVGNEGRDGWLHHCAGGG